jgi:hypothetical protein
MVNVAWTSLSSSGECIQRTQDTRLTNERLALLCFKLAVLLLLLIGRSVFAAAQLKRQST